MFPTRSDQWCRHGDTGQAVYCPYRLNPQILPKGPDDTRTRLVVVVFVVVVVRSPRTPLKPFLFGPGLRFDDHKVVTSGFDSLVKIWDLRTLSSSGGVGRTALGSLPRVTLQAPPASRCTRLAYDDTRVVTGSLAGAV